MHKDIGARKVLTSIVLAGCLLLGACSSDEILDAAGQGDTLPLPVEPSDETTPLTGEEMGKAAMNSPVIDGQPWGIDSFSIAESSPEQIGVTFSAGAEACMAAEATATATGDTVTISLSVGISDSAAFTSCVQGIFPHTLNIQLTEDLAGREVVLAQP